MGARLGKGEREREREEKKLEFNGPSSIVTSLNSGNL
jgi:hypothetical protein